MEKIAVASLHKKSSHLLSKLKQFKKKLERLSAEDLFETLTSVMFRIILFLGVPYFLFVLWSFVRMYG